MPNSPVDRRYRYVYKPLVFAACLIPLAWVAGGILDAYGLLQLRAADLGADPLRQILDIFGKSALNILLITLAITPLRQLSGNSHLIRLRRMLGLFAFCYALLHFVVYVGPYSGLDWAAIGADILKRPYITIGFAALLLLLPLAITSTNKMMRRLGRRWQRLHRLIYLIAVLGIFHFWKMLKHDFSEPLLYASILAALFAWRIGHSYRRRAAARRATSTSVLPRAPEKNADAAPSPDS